jgi:hypothetical protein
LHSLFQSAFSSIELRLVSISSHKQHFYFLKFELGHLHGYSYIVHKSFPSLTDCNHNFFRFYKHQNNFVQGLTTLNAHITWSIDDPGDLPQKCHHLFIYRYCVSLYLKTKSSGKKHFEFILNSLWIHFEFILNSFWIHFEFRTKWGQYF